VYAIVRPVDICEICTKTAIFFLKIYFIFLSLLEIIIKL